MSLSDPRELGAALSRHGVRARRSLGQRFLVDKSALSAIVEAAELSPSDHVLEIGPGPGVLTRELSERAASVTAVEVDERMVAVLRDTLGAATNVTVVRADALSIDLHGVAAHPLTRIVANLPYQITSPLLISFLSDDRRPPLIVVLVQEEVAKRIVAGARSGGERGYLSIFVQSYATPRIVRRVPARAFRPAPRVNSAIVALRTHPVPAFAPLAGGPFLRLVSDAFRHRRKQLRSALGHEAGIERERAEDALRAAGIAPTRRPEELALPEWVALAHALGIPST
ncbi:MAG: ribosomal RNA small subunit methyltransferase A [Chloroflexi bacterium]|nr:ribosomal RNA small subunit methyltransferase A [Chloroflexota bacterium]